MQRRAAAVGEWRMLICVIYAMTLLLDMAIPTQSYVRYDFGGITRGRHVRRAVALYNHERANGCNLVRLFIDCISTNVINVRKKVINVYKRVYYQKLSKRL